MKLKEVPHRKGDIATHSPHVLQPAAEGRFVHWIKASPAPAAEAKPRKSLARRVAA